MVKMATSSPRSEVAGRVRGKIKRASQLEHNLRLLVYGTSGKGKTRVCATAPNPIIFDVNEQGTLSTRDTDPNVYPIENWTDLVEGYWYLQEGDHDHQTVCIDGVTAMQNLCMKFVLGDEASRDASRDPDMPTRQAWGKVGELMKTQITNFRNLPMNVVFTALTRTKSSGDEGDDLIEVVTGPNCSPSVAGHLEAAVDIIGYLSTREVVVKRKKRGSDKITQVKTTRRQLLVGPSERYVTKDRSGKLGDVVKAPDISEIIELTFSKEA